MKNVLNIKDTFYDLMKEPTKENFRTFVKYNTGEEDNIDFKKDWIEKEELAKLLLALANIGGGLIVFGLQENEDGSYNPVGSEEFKDQADINNQISRYIPPSLEYKILDFNFDASEYEKLINKKFQIIIVIDSPEELPFISKGQGKSIIEDTIYVRRGTKNERANFKEIERILNRRINSMYSSSSTLELSEHIEQLEYLYGKISNTKMKLVKKGEPTGIQAFGLALQQAFQSNDIYENIPNENYPSEDFEEFIARMIKRKKIKVEKVLDLK